MIFFGSLLFPTTSFGDVVVSDLVKLTNADRAVNNLQGLTVNPILEKAAQMKADDMAVKEYFAHDSPEGKTPWHWFQQVKYSYSFAGENLAVYFSDSNEVERSWMNSPTHRANILNANFTEVGIATANGKYQGQETVFVVQMFGKPSVVVSTTTESKTDIPVEMSTKVLVEDDTPIAVENILKKVDEVVVEKEKIATTAISLSKEILAERSTPLILTIIYGLISFFVFIVIVGVIIKIFKNSK